MAAAWYRCGFRQRSKKRRVVVLNLDADFLEFGAARFNVSLDIGVGDEEPRIAYLPYSSVSSPLSVD